MDQGILPQNAREKKNQVAKKYSFIYPEIPLMEEIRLTTWDVEKNL